MGRRELAAKGGAETASATPRQRLTEGDISFEHVLSSQYTIFDGLAGMHIEDIYQDRQGFLWIATADGGVSRFDSARFDTFGLKDGLPNLTVMAIAEDVLRDAYRAEGRSALFDPRNILFLSEEQFAFAAGYIGLVQREQVAGAFLFGHFAAESLILAEAGQQVGAMQVGASVSPEQVAFFITACDYTLIGEELFAASAYLTREPIQLGSLYGQDRAKLFLFLMIVTGVGIATLNAVWPDLGLTNLDALLQVGWSLGL